MSDFDQILVDLIVSSLGLSAKEVESVLEVPSDSTHGDRSLPCFRWSKTQKKSPSDLAKHWQSKILSQELPSQVKKVECVGGYLNFYSNLSWLSKTVLAEIKEHPNCFGFVRNSTPPLVVIEYSSPNIAKPFSIGHLRSTNIGASLCRIFKARGWRVVSLNHLGDWGTQFGKLMTAYRRWGSAGNLGEKPMYSLLKLYVKFHEEEENDPTLIEEARSWFARLEQGDSEAKELWEWFRELTLEELRKLYQMLSVEFDHFWGESFYVSELPGLCKELDEKGLTKRSEDATVIDLEPYHLSVALIRKKDESSLYLTRDLAAAIYRNKHFQFDQMLYVVGAPQRLHFQQVFKILELMGHSWMSRCEHVMFGHMSFGDQNMSTRKGNVVFFEEVLDRATELAKKIVAEKNPELEERDEVAKAVGLGAILFADVSSKRIKDVQFSWEEILSFEGETGPYLQYTAVRTLSLLRRFDQPIHSQVDFGLLNSEEEASVIRTLSFFPLTLAKAEEQREPFLLSQYLIELAREFNRFYNAHRILDVSDSKLVEARMLLVHCVSDVLRTGLGLLGIPSPERM